MRRSYSCKCCQCQGPQSEINIAAGQTIVRNADGFSGVSASFYGPEDLSEWTVTFGFQCDEDGGAPQVKMRISCVSGGTAPGNKLSAITKEPDTANSIVYPPPAPIEFFHYIIETLDGDDESLDRRLVPLLPGNDINGNGLLYTRWSHFFRVYCKRYEDQAYLALHIVGKEQMNSNPELGYPGLGIFLLPLGVRHLFPPVTVDSKPAFSVHSTIDVGFSISLVNTTREALNALPAEHGEPCETPPPPLIAASDEEEDYQDYPEMQVSLCEYRKRSSHVPHALEGKSFTALRASFELSGWGTAGNFPEGPYELGAKADDDTDLCDGAFWFADNPMSQMRLYDVNGFSFTELTLQRIEIAVCMNTVTGRPCTPETGTENPSFPWVGTEGNYSSVVFAVIRLQFADFSLFMRPALTTSLGVLRNYGTTQDGFDLLRGEPVTLTVAEFGYMNAQGAYRLMYRRYSPIESMTIQLVE